jgi:hypothetical protein
MAVLFDDFGQFFQPVLTSAHQKVVQLAQRCSTAITAGTINWALYRKWFDAAGNRNLNNVTQVRRTINGILTRLQTTDITYKNCNGDHMHCAYGVHGNQANLHGYTMIIPGVGMQPQLNPKTGRPHNEVLLIPKPNVANLTVTMYHELSHLVTGTNDAHGYNEAVCLGLPVNDPAAAITHAANYGFFAKELYQ